MDGSGGWSTTTWGEMNATIAAVQKALVFAGVEAGDVVGILGSNSFEWAATALGVMMLGGVVAGLWEDADLATLHWQVEHARPKVVFVAGEAELAKMVALPGASEYVQAVVSFFADIESPRPVPTAVEENGNASFEAGNEVEHAPFRVWGWIPFLSSGQRTITDALLVRRGGKVSPGSTALLAFTSGTTGTPKAAMLSHDNLAYAAQGMGAALAPSADEHIVSYMSLALVSNFVFDILTSIVTGAATWFGPEDSVASSILPLLQDVRPTFFNGCPRVWEDLERACIAAGVEVDSNSLGLDRCRYAASSGGFLPPHVAEFFASAAVYIVQIYGTAETSGVAAISSELSPLVSVGVPLGTTAIALADENEDGDGILAVKGRTVFKGYYNDEESSRRRILDSGFFVSGDIGRIDDGYVFVHGPKRDMIKVGEDNFVAPAPVEALLKAQLPIVADVLVFGSEKDALCAFITLKSQTEGAGTPSSFISVHTHAILESMGIELESDAMDDVTSDERILALVDRAVRSYNDSLENSGCAIDQWTFVPAPFAVAKRELTPSYKTKRRVVLTQYKAQASQLMAAASSAPAAAASAPGSNPPGTPFSAAYGVGYNNGSIYGSSYGGPGFGNDSMLGVGPSLLFPPAWLGPRMLRPFAPPAPLSPMAPFGFPTSPFFNPGLPMSPLQFFRDLNFDEDDD